MFENTIFLISFSWASIAESLVNMDSLFTISPPPHLCVANQPVGHMELFMLKEVSNAPGQTGFRQMYHSPFGQSPPPPDPISLSWAEPPWSQG